MIHKEIPQPAYDTLVRSIVRILMKKGIKNTKMDDIARTLQISKRTLYEIFSNKSEMVGEVMKRFHSDLLDYTLEYQRNAENVMDSILMSFIHYRNIMQHINVDFFIDFETFYTDQRHKTDPVEREYMENFKGLLHQAEKEGYIRSDLDYMLQFRIMQVQMNLLKRMYEFFPKDIALLEVYDTNAVTFLRGIASPKGLEAIDKRITLFDEIQANH